MSRIKICQLITELRPAGAERCVYELARRLDRDRFDVHVMALRGGRVADWLDQEGIPVTVLNVRGRWDLSRLYSLVGHLRAGQFDLLHTHLFHGDLIGRAGARLVGIPHLVHTVHVAEGRFRPWQFAHARLGANYYDRIVCVSESVKAYHAKRAGLPDRLYTTILNGIDVEHFKRNEKTRKQLREEWGLAGDQVLLAFVGRLDRQKGIDTLLAAVSHLGARGEQAHLVVAGDGAKRNLVENFIRYGEGGAGTKWLGFVEDIPGLLSAADVLVMPSRWEGFGLAAAEAMAAAVPVIATNVPGLREVVVDDQTGIVVEPDNGQALAGAIEKLSADADLRFRLGRAGLERVRSLFPIDKNISAHEELYQQVAGG